LATFAVLAVVWQLVAEHNKYVIPRLNVIWTSLSTQPEYYVHNAKVTFVEAITGLACGVAAAFVMAILMSQINLFRRSIMPLAVMLNVTPVITVAPALVVAFGFGMAPKVLVTAIITFFPALIASSAGLRSVDKEVLEVFRSLHATRFEELFKLRLPTSLPFLFAGARVVFPLSIIGAVVAEFVAPGSSNGLGNKILLASGYSQLNIVYACIFCLSIMGILMTLAVTLVEWIVLSRGGMAATSRR
jgi:NitT/TauT family transport system permease protein